MRDTLVRVIKHEFHGHLRHLENNKPHRFATSQWHLGSKPPGTSSVATYLVYRWLIALFFVITMILSIYEPRTVDWEPETRLTRRNKWAIYITHWSLLALTLETILAAYMATKHHLRIGKPDASMTVIHKAYWVLFNISNVTAPVVTLGYWLTVYNPEIHPIDFLNIAAHLLNTLLVLVDMMVVAHPVRLLHAYQPLLLMAVYLAFTGFYFVLGGTNREGNLNIYPLLNWSKPLQTVVATAAAAFFLVILHILFWLLYQLRRSTAKSCQSRTPVKNADMRKDEPSETTNMFTISANVV